MPVLAFDDACRSAELVMYTNTTEAWPISTWLIGHTNQTSLDMVDMVPFDGNFSRSLRVWYLVHGSSSARLSLAFDEEVYLRPEIDWRSIYADVEHLLLYSATQEYNWTVLAAVNATNSSNALFEGIAVSSGYITYGVTKPIVPPAEPCCGANWIASWACSRSCFSPGRRARDPGPSSCFCRTHHLSVYIRGNTCFTVHYIGLWCYPPKLLVVTWSQKTITPS